jgi:hypothetical protein
MRRVGPARLTRRAGRGQDARTARPDEEPATGATDTLGSDAGRRLSAGAPREPVFDKPGLRREVSSVAAFALQQQFGAFDLRMISLAVVSSTSEPQRRGIPSQFFGRKCARSLIFEFR